LEGVGMGRVSEIAKIFYQDVREKKRVGSNIYKRASTRRGGAGTVRSAYDFLSNKEKKKLNSEVRTYNMNDLLVKEEFEKLSNTEQKERLEHWRKKYKNTEIIKSLGIHASTYYVMLDELDVKRDNNRGAFRQTSVVSQKELDYYKNNICSYDELMSLDVEQRMEVFEGYDKAYGTSELAKQLGTSTHNIYYLRNKLKTYKAKKKRERKAIAISSEPIKMKDEVTKVDEINVFEDTNLDTANEPIETSEIDVAEVTDAEESVEVTNSFSFDIKLSGQYAKEEFLNRITNVLNLLNDDEIAEFQFSMRK
jgi:hypothetical protein